MANLADRFPVAKALGRGRRASPGQGSRLVTACLCAFLVTATVFTGGCGTTTSHKDIGTVVGGVLGGFLGREIDDGGTGGAIIGALVGAAVGRMIGHYMDESDRRRLAETLEEAPQGQTVSWQNERSGNEFEVTPTSDYYAEGDQRCRTFEQVVYVDGRREIMQGTACKSPGSDELAIEGSAI